MGKSRNRSGVRGAFVTTSQRLSPRFQFRPLPTWTPNWSSVVTSIADPVDDRRRFQPAPRMLVSRAGRSVGIHSPSPLLSPAFTMFGEPLSRSLKKTVGVCVRRKQRREVIFAGGGGGKRFRTRKPRRNELSDVRC